VSLRLRIASDRPFLIRSLQSFVKKLESLRPLVVKTAQELHDKEDKELREREEIAAAMIKRESKDDDEAARERERDRERDRYIFLVCLCCRHL
jgi:hypothetical protein